VSLRIPPPAPGVDGQTAPQRREAVRRDPVARWERMVEIRRAELRIRELHQQGKAWGTTHCADWQEAVAVGVAAAARPTDLLSCTHRTHHWGLALGVTPDALLAENIGRATGPLRGLGGSMHLTDVSVGLLHSFPIIGSQIPIAAGNAYAAQVAGRDDAAIAVFGDGAANIGAFHETLNLASVWRLPVVFVCEHNVYAEYTHAGRTTPVADIAVRGESYAMAARIVDGQDVDAVQAATAEALARARAGEGPTLLEMKTYRWLGHSANDRAAYRRAGEADAWGPRDPIALHERRLRDDGLLDDERVDELLGAVGRRIDAATERALAAPEPTVADMFRHVVVAEPEER
jgi:pyruvate dehydrogenase E1 component alpha subunit